MSPVYAAEVQAGIGSATTSANAAKVANIPTFIWFDMITKSPPLGTYLTDAFAKQKASGEKFLVPIVVYDFPDLDYAAAASNGEFEIAKNGLTNYMSYIDQLVAQIKSAYSILGRLLLY